MTREELKYTISSCGCFIYRGQTYYEESELMKAFEDMGLINQEPSGDLIQRQAVLDLVADYDLSMGQVVRGIHALPSVKPQEKTGHWIGIDEEPHEVWECDHCGFVIDGSGCIDPYDYRDTYKYCPYCGARMVEEQERSE